MNNRKKQSGFSLVELLLYISIVGVMIGASMGVYYSYVSGKERARVITQIEYSGNAINSLIEEMIQSAQSVQVPATSTISNTLTLAMASTTINPVQFLIINDQLNISKGSSGMTPLHSSQFLISSTTFTNMSRPNTSGSVSFSFTLKTLGIPVEYSYTQTFYGSATIRK